MRGITEYQKELKTKYGNKYDKNNQQRQGDYEYMFYAPKQYGVEDDILYFMKENPNVTFKELLKYVDTQIPNIEIVDEDIAD